MSAENQNSTVGREMSFLDHLEELRWRIIKAVIALLLGSVACAFFADFLVQVALLGPLRAAQLKVQVLAPYGIMLLYMEVILFGGLIISMPFIPGQSAGLFAGIVMVAIFIIVYFVMYSVRKRRAMH